MTGICSLKQVSLAFNWFLHVSVRKQICLPETSPVVNPISRTKGCTWFLFLLEGVDGEHYPKSLSGRAIEAIRARALLKRTTGNRGLAPYRLIIVEKRRKMSTQETKGGKGLN